jgi:hypothetical protein
VGRNLNIILYKIIIICFRYGNCFEISVNEDKGSLPLKMFFLKSDDHLFKVRKELYEDDTNSDLTLVAEGSTFHGHSQLIFHHVPGLSKLVCDGCKNTHEKTVIFLTGVKQEFVEIALLEFYIKGDPTKLRSVLNLGSESSEMNTTKDKLG